MTNPVAISVNSALYRCWVAGNSLVVWQLVLQGDCVDL